MRYVRQGGDVAAETLRIEQALAGPTVLALYLEKTFAAPLTPPDGMILYADGTVWNPGAGEGVYVYYGAAWNLLG